MKTIGILSAAFSALILAGCGGGSGGQVVAKVNGQDITKDAYLKQLETMDSVLVLVQGRPVRAQLAEPLSAQALNNLIEQQLILQFARDENVIPAKDDVDRMKRIRNELNPDFLDQMKAIGYTNEEIDRLVQVQLAQYNLTVRNSKEKTIKDVEEFVQKNPKLFVQPATVTFRWIVVDTDKKKDGAEKDLLSGMSFGAVAAKYSILPGAKDDNGAYPSGQGPQSRPVPLNNLPSELRAIVNKVSEGQQSAWQKVQGGWVRVLVESKTAEQPYKPSPAQMELIRMELSQNEAAPNNNVERSLQEKLLAAEIQVFPPYLKKSWERTFASIKQRYQSEEKVSPEGPSETTTPSGN